MTDIATLRRLVSAPREAVEEIPCALCGGDDVTLLYAPRTPEGEVFPVVRCLRCDLVYVNPRRKQETLAEIYRKARYFQTSAEGGSGYDDYLADRDLHLAFFRAQLDRIEERVARGRLLEVGCATGFLLEEARRRGWDVAGVELSEFASGYARERLGLPVVTGTLRQALFPDGHFGAAVLDDVLEHFADPLSELAELRRVLAPGGVALFHTPNADSPWHRLMGKHWVHTKPGEHLFYFTPATVSSLLQRSGFEVASARPCGKPTHLVYIASRAKRYSLRLGSALQWAVARFPFARRPFPFRSGEMEVLSIRR